MENICRRIAQYAFFIGVFIETLLVIFDKSAYVIQYDGWIFRITFLLFLCKVVCTKYSIKEYGYLIFFLIIGGVSYYVTGRNEIIRIVIFVAACKDIDMMRTLKFVFWMTVLGVIALILLSVTGVYGTVAITNDFGRGVVQTRYCLGLGHPNALHCMVFVLTLLGIYLYHEKTGLIGYIIATIINIAFFVLTDSKSSMIAVIIFLIFASILQFSDKMQKTKWIYVLGILLLLFAVIISVLMAIYSTDLPLFAKLDRYLTGRIVSLKDSGRHEGMIETWSAFSIEENDNYFDLGFVRLFFWYGWIPTLLYVLLQIKLLLVSSKKKDYMLLAVMITCTIYTIVEAHLVSVYIGRNYLLFFMGMYLKQLTGTKDEEEEKYPILSWQFVNQLVRKQV